MNFKRVFGGCAAALAIAAFSAVAPIANASSSPFKSLAGYWTGAGTVYLQSGAREEVRCRAIYRTSSSGTSGSQKLNCQSLAGYGIAAKSNMNYSRGRVSGTWTEDNFNATGNVSGSATSRSMALSLNGGSFSAGMNVSFSKCNQNVNISTKAGGISRIEIRLGRC